MIVFAIPLVFSLCVGISLGVVGERVESNATSTLPAWCHGYKVLDRADRNIDNTDCINNSNFCFQDGTEGQADGGPPETSSDWQGPGYYRFLEPAGTMLSTVPPNEKHCGTWGPGWTRDSSHPEEVGEIKSMIVCYHIPGGNFPGAGCQLDVEISVTNCDGYYVYWLVDNTGYTGSFLPGRFCGA